MEDYINNFKNYEKTIVYDFKLGDGGIGDYLKFFMIILTECMNSSSKVKLYHKINDLEIEKYIKLKYDFMNIGSDKISELIPKFIHPLSTTISFLVFLTELIIGLVSNGRKDLKSINSVLTP